MPGGIHPPLSVIEAWPATNYIDPVRRGWDLVILCTVLFGITAIIVAARLWARLVLQLNAGLDDALIVVAMIPTAGLALAVGLGSRLWGFDRHVWDLTFEKAVQSREDAFAMEAFYVASTGLTKISILLFYRRLASGSVSKVFIYTVWTCIGFVIAYMVSFLVVLLLDCRPLHAYWDQVDFRWPKTHKYTCIDEASALLSACVISIVQDFAACGMPALLFWKLQLPKRQKVALSGIFAVGFFLCITGILRIIYVRDIFYATYDVTWAAYPAWAWTAVEAHLAIVCASAPALKVFFARYLDGSVLGSHLSHSLKRSAYQRKGYYASHQQQRTGPTDKSERDFGHSAVVSMSDRGRGPGKGDLEMGGIEVAREVDVVVESRGESGSEYDSSGRSSQEQLKSGKGGVSVSLQEVMPDLPPPPSSDAYHCWRR